MAGSETHLEKIRRQFTRQADAYERNEQARDEEGMAVLAAICETGPTDETLDVACGPGFLTLAFADRARHATGVDATDALLDLARARARARTVANVRFVSGDATRLDFPDDRYDIVSCRAAFHHFPEPKLVLAEMKRVAAPGGKLLIADLLGSDDPERAAYHDRIEKLCDPTHVRALPEAEFVGLFESANLEIVHRFERPLDYALDEWLLHGGPSPEAEAEIRELFEGSLETDRCGLDVRQEEGAIHFSHRGAAFILRKAVE